MKDHLFQWSDDFITGVESIDKQHFTLIEIINDTLKLCFQNDTESFFQFKRFGGSR